MICKTSIGAMRSNNLTCRQDCSYLGYAEPMGRKQYICFRFYVPLQTMRNAPRICEKCQFILQIYKRKR